MSTDAFINLLRRPTMVLGLSLAVVLATVGGWWVFQPQGEDPQANAEPFVYGYCPRCGLEITLPPGARFDPPRCFRCDRKDAPLFKISARPRDAFSFEALVPDGRVLAVAIGVLSLLGLALFLARRNQKAATEAPLLSLRCPVCSHRLRYRPDQVGQHGVCPSCKEPVKYPVARRCEEVADWVEGLAQWSKEIQDKKNRSRKNND
jgi:hypothetical protein